MGDTGVLSYSHGWIILTGYGAYHAYATLCMGNCPACRKNRENPHKYKLRRLAGKNELRRRIKSDVHGWESEEAYHNDSEARIDHQMCILFCQEEWCEREDEKGVVHYEDILKAQKDLPPWDR